MSRIRRRVRQVSVALRRAARDWLAIAGAVCVAIGLAAMLSIGAAWLWVGAFLIFTAGAGRRAS